MCVPFFQSCEPLSLQLGGAMLSVLIIAALFFVILYFSTRFVGHPFFSWVRSPFVVICTLLVLFGC
jgi:hypothetical protein